MLPRLSPIALSLLLLITTIHAKSSITLGGFFQQLPFGITGSCRTAYNLPLDGCSADDFQQDSACSDECIITLERRSETLNTVCSGFIVDARTLLGLIFQGNLVPAVCNLNVAPNTDTPEPTTSAPVLSRSTSTVGPVTSDDAPARTTVEAPSSSPVSSTTSTDTPIRSSAGLGLGDPETTPTSTATELVTETVNSNTGTSNNAAEPTGLTRQQEQILANKDSGGGTLFDIVAVDSGAVHVGTSLMASLVGALLVAFVLVR